MFFYFKNITWLNLAKITWILIGIFIVIIFSFCLFKYYTFNYNCLDLAIYNQVFFNSSNGQLFHFTIHPTSYLGDHFELIILLLLPFYNLLKSPLTLLFIQACFLGFSAIPLFLIAKKYLTPLLGLLIICLYLFNAATFNIALFEFHILSLTIFFILWAFYFYDQNKFWPFLIFCFLSLIIREDVAFIIFMFGLISLIDRKKIKWIFTPIILSAAYFFLAIKLSALFSGRPSYKFLHFYSWLGNSIWEIFINFFLRFPEVLKHIFYNITNWELLLGLLLIVLFIPLYRPKYLLLAIPTLLEFWLSTNTSSLIIQTHYISLFLPSLLIASIFSLKDLKNNSKIINFHKKFIEIIPTALIISLVYCLLSLSPIFSFIIAPFSTDYYEIANKKEFIKQIPKSASVLTSFDLLTNLSSRSQLYLIRYAYLNRQQFNAGDYPLPENLQYILINTDDFYYLDDYSHSELYKSYYFQGDDRLREILTKNYSLIKVHNNLKLWQKNGQRTDLSLYKIYLTPPEIENKKNQIIGSKIQFLGWDENPGIKSLYFKCLEPMDKNYFLVINNRYYPLGSELYPTSEWQPNQIIQTNLYNLKPFTAFQISHPIGSLKLGPLNSFQKILSSTEILADINLN